MNYYKNIFIFLTTLLLLLGLSSSVFAYNVVPESSLYVTDGVVKDIKAAHNLIYLGGEFTYVGPPNGYGVPINMSTKLPVDNFPYVNGIVNDVVPDGSGGWFIGGSFTEVGGVTRNRLAHILPNGSVDPDWDPNLNNTVHALGINGDGSTLYAGGIFTTVEGGTSRPYIAAFRTTPPPETCNVTGAPLTESFEGETFPPDGWETGGTASWVSTVDYFQDGVKAAQTGAPISSGQNTYLKKQVTFASDGELKFYWKLNTNSSNRLMLCIDNDNCTRSTAASYHTSIVGTVDWTEVTVPISKGTHSIMWKFEKGTNTITGVDRGWVDNIRTFEYEEHPCGDGATILKLFNARGFSSSAKVYSISLTPDESQLFIGGYFSYLNYLYSGNSVARFGIASIDPYSGIANPWVADAKKTSYSGSVYAIDINDTNVYFGGDFTTVNGTSKKNYAVTDLVNGTLSDFNPAPDNYVRAIKVTGDKAWIGGNFLNVDGQPRYKFAALNLDGTLNDWQAPRISYSSTNVISDLEVADGKVYIGGNFTQVYDVENGSANHFAVFDESTAELLELEPRAIGSIKAFAFNNDNSVLYMGGDFISAGGKQQKYLAVIDPQTGQSTDWNPSVNGVVNSIEVKDSTVYVGGHFSEVEGVTRSKIAALDACTGGVLDWDFSIDDGGDLISNSVFDLELSQDSSTLYVGGRFTHLGEEVRSRAGAIDLITNQVTTWDPRVNDDVFVIKDAGDTVYLGGDFTRVGSSQKQNLVAVNNTTGAVIETFSPNPNWEIEALEITQDNSTLYVGGFFYYIGGEARQGLAAINTINGTVLDWNPGLSLYDGIVSLKLDTSEDLIYIGGNFYTVGDQPRTVIAAVSTDDATVDAWNPTITYNGAPIVNDLEFSGTSLFIGGRFKTVEGVTAYNFAQFNPYADQGNGLDCSSPPQTEPTSAPTPTPTVLPSTLGLSLSAPEFSYPNPNPTTITNQDTLLFGDWYWWASGGALSIHQSDEQIYVGGDFSLVGPKAYSTAKLNKNSGEVTGSIIPFVCTDDGYCGEIETIIPDGAGGWYVGGDFVYKEDESLINLAHVLADGTVDTSFKPNPDDYVYTLALSSNGNTLYVGGRFATVDDQARNKLAAVSTVDGSVYAWNPVPNDSVYSIAVKSDNSAVYVGGKFTSFTPTVTTITRNRIAAISTDPTVAVPTIYDWNPNVSTSNGSVEDLKFSADESILYMGGRFNTVDGQTRNLLTAVETGTDTDTDDLYPWNPNIDGWRIDTMFIDGNTMYVGGDFTAVGDSRVKSLSLAGIDLSTGLPTSFVNHDIEGDVYTIVADDSKIYIGGAYFNTVNGKRRVGTAIFDKSTGELSSLTANVFGDWYVNTMVIAGDTLYVGGYFSTIGATEVGNIIRLNSDGSLDETWNPMANGIVRSVTKRNGIIYAGGEFTSIGGQTQNYIAALNETNGQAVDWGIEANSYVEELHVGGCNLYVGGWFSRIGNEDRTRAASISLVDNTVNNWNPAPDDVVYTIATANSSVYLGGEFTQVGGNDRNRVVAVDQKTGKITSWDPQLSSDYSSWPVFKIATKGEHIYIGGYFDYVGGIEQYALARVDLEGNFDTNWAPQVDDVVWDIVFTSDTVYIAGEFWEVNGEERLYVAALNESDGTSTDWNPEYSYYYDDHGGSSILVSGDSVLVGGDFCSFLTDTWGFAWYGTELGGAPDPVVEFCDCRESASETDTPNLYVATSRKSDSPITVDYTSVDGTAIAGEDYVALSGTATIPANEYYAAIPVTLIDDGVEEESEDFRVDLSNLSSGVLGWYSQNYFSIGGFTDGGGEEEPTPTPTSTSTPTPTPTSSQPVPTSTSTPTPTTGAQPTPTNAPISAPTSAVTPTPTGSVASTVASSETSDSSSSPQECTDTISIKPPWLYGATPLGKKNIKLYFTDADDPVGHYAVEYGTQSGVYQYSGNHIGGKGARTYTVTHLEPGTTYYFRVRAGNGCATGPWSNEISATTDSFTNSTDLVTEIIEVKTQDTQPEEDEEQREQQEDDQSDGNQSEEQKPIGGYTLKVKIVDSLKEAVKGVKVVLAAENKEVETDENGVAVFEGVAKGEHDIVIDYGDKQGRQTIVVQGDEDTIEFTVKMSPKSSFTDLPVILVISVLLLGLLFTSFMLWKRKNKSY